MILSILLIILFENVFAIVLKLMMFYNMMQWHSYIFKCGQTHFRATVNKMHVLLPGALLDPFFLGQGPPVKYCCVSQYYILTWEYFFWYFSNKCMCFFSISYLESELMMQDLRTNHSLMSQTGLQKGLKLFVIQFDSLRPFTHTLNCLHRYLTPH